VSFTSPRIFDALIVTAIPVEYQAVREHLVNLKDQVINGSVFEQGTFVCPNISWNVTIVEVGAGNLGAAIETALAIKHFRPAAVLFVGVAGGLKDAGIGDVVAGTKIYYYECGKALEEFHTRPDLGKCTHRVVQRARAEARKTDWTQRIKPKVPAAVPKVVVGPIAAGEQVVASVSSEVYKLIRKNYSDALAVEMEGAGFMKAVETTSGVQALVVRGISDLIENKAAADAAGSQETAAKHASAFAFEVLAKLFQTSGDFRGDAFTETGVSVAQLAIDTSPETLRQLMEWAYQKGKTERAFYAEPTAVNPNQELHAEELIRLSTETQDFVDATEIDKAFASALRLEKLLETENPLVTIEERKKHHALLARVYVIKGLDSKTAGASGEEYLSKAKALLAKAKQQ